MVHDSFHHQERFMSTIRCVAQTFVLGVAVLGAALAQTYPNKPIRIVTASAGAGSDFVARLIAQETSGPLGQQIIIDNRASGVIPAEIVAKSPPDGYTLLVYTNAVWNLPLLQSTSYDPLRDFSPITAVTKSPVLLVVHPALPVRSVTELIALAKARPGELNASTGATGGSGHMALELFKSLVHVKITRIPYSSGAIEILDLLSGRMQMTFGPAAETSQLVKAGKLRALAVTTAKPSALFPELPTVAATVPGYEWVGTTALFAPANTPAAVINRLNREVVQALRRAEVKERVVSVGSEVIGSTPEQLAAEIKSDMVRLGRLIKDAGIRVE